MNEQVKEKFKKSFSRGEIIKNIMINTVVPLVVYSVLPIIQ